MVKNHKNNNKNSSNSLVFGRWPQTKILQLMNWCIQHWSISWKCGIFLQAFSKFSPSFQWQQWMNCYKASVCSRFCGPIVISIKSSIKLQSYTEHLNLACCGFLINLNIDLLPNIFTTNPLSRDFNQGRFAHAWTESWHQQILTSSLLHLCNQCMKKTKILID